MALLSPDILLPTTAGTFRAGSVGILVSGTMDPVTTAIYYTYAIAADAPGPFPSPSSPQTAGITLGAPQVGPETTLPWSLDTSYVPGLAYSTKAQFVFWAYNSITLETSLTTTLDISFALPQNISVVSPVPSGIGIERRNYSITVSNQGMPELPATQNFVGFNYYVSTTSGSGYTRMNRDYVSTPSSQGLVPGVTEVSTSLSGNVQVDTKVTQLVPSDTYSFIFDKDLLATLQSEGKITVGNDGASTTFYFVVTSVIFNQTMGEVVESLYSSEIGAMFLAFVPQFQELPARTRMDIVRSMSGRLLSLNPKLNILSGGVLRDQIDPIAEEFSDYYMVQDFISRTQSLDGLVAFDDANGDGISDPVATSSAKLTLQGALRLPNDQMVQSIIDAYFEKYAANFNLSRIPSTFAIGKVLFYASSIPPEGLIIEDGATLISKADTNNGVASQRFKVLGGKQLSYADRSRYYNATTGRYEVGADIEAQGSGTGGNVNAGDINQLVDGADLRFKVINTSSTYNGKDTESNLSLANRTKLAMAGLDTGTEAGYMLKALSVGGVLSVRVEKSGDPLMRRDIDPVNGEHIGGKVDVYVQGVMPVQVQDVFAFSYAGPEGTQQGDRFYVEDATSFRIRTNAPAVTAATPIFEVVRVTNVSKGKDYNVSGAVAGLGDGDTIELAMNPDNLAIGMATLDMLEVDYRYRGSNSMTLSVQPVDSIVSVVGDVDGPLPPENYSFIKLEDPLLTGYSTIAHDGVTLQFFNNLPSQTVQSIVAETHVLTLDRNAVLTRKGVDTDTIVVSSDTGATNRYKRDLDYRVIKGGDNEFVNIALVQNGKIRNGSTVYVNYSAGQNFTVTYLTNKLLSQVQSELDSMRHAAADVIVKQCFRNEVDIAVRVIRTRGTSESDVVNKVASGLSAKVQSLKLGEPLNLDDVVNIVKNTTGVKTVTLPLARVMKKNGSFIPNDVVGTTDFQVYSQNTGRGVTSYISVNPVLSYGTLDQGGDPNLFRAIYENGRPLVLASTPNGVSAAQGRGYINADGRIVVSTLDGAPPQMKSYSVAYYSYVSPDNEFAADITVDSMESLVVGANSFTIDASSEEQVIRRGL